MSPKKNHLPLTTHSFFLLPKQQRERVEQLFTAYAKNQAETLESLSYEWLFNHRDSIDYQANIHINELSSMNPASFIYLNDAKKEHIEHTLLHAFYILLAQYRLNRIEQKKPEADKALFYIQQTAARIYQLRLSNLPNCPYTEFGKNMAACEHHSKFLGLDIGHRIADEVRNIRDGKIQSARDVLASVNERRLYLVWTEQFTTSLLSLITNKQAHRADQTIHSIDPAMSYLGWVVYYCRFAIESSLVLKKTFTGAWSSQEDKEANISTWRRFQYTWDKRKFILLNDLVWATANLLTSMVLIGSKQQRYAGSIISVALLGMDLALSVWKMLETATKHNAEKRLLEEELLSLRQKHQSISALITKTTIDKTIKDDERKQAISKRTQELEQIALGIDRLESLLAKKEIAWQYHQYRNLNQCMYTLGILAGYATSVYCLIPSSLMSQTTLFVLGLTGGAICFALTLLYTAVNGYLDITEIKAQKTLNEKKLAVLIDKFKDEKDNLTKKQLFLSIQQLHATTHHQQALIAHQQLSIARQIVTDVMIPFFVLTTFLVLPTGAGIGALALGLILTIAITKLIDSYKPIEKQAPTFDDELYQAFTQKPVLSTLSQTEIMAPASDDQEESRSEVDKVDSKPTPNHG